MACKFECLGDKCAANCCGAFNGVVSSIKSLEGHHASSIALDERSYNHIKSIGRTDSTFYDSKKGLHYVKLNDDKSCKFFSNGLCEIYENKPPVCSAYPFYLDQFSGLSIDTNCPGVSDTNGDVDYQKEYPVEIQAIKEVIDLQLKNIK